MRGSYGVRRAVAAAALGYFPPGIRESLSADARFQKAYGVTGDYVLTFNGSGASIRRHALARAVRKVLGGCRESKVVDVNQRKWRLRRTKAATLVPGLFLSRGSTTQQLDGVWAVLSEDRDTRLRALSEEGRKANLPHSAIDGWRRLVVDRALRDGEVMALLDDLKDTPAMVLATLRQGLRDRQADMSMLVPGSRRYFARLVGAYDGSVGVEAYAAQEGGTHLATLAARGGAERLLYSLHVTAHPDLTNAISTDGLENEELLEVLETIAGCGDRMSQVGAIEMCFRVLSARPEVGPFLVRLIEAIRGDDVQQAESGIVLLSSLFHLVDGELSRGRILGREPPFYRRLAALAQAGLSAGAVRRSNVDMDAFVRWAFEASRWQFELQSYVDMRTEPRWEYRFGAPGQFRAWLVGRVVRAAARHRAGTVGGEVGAAVQELRRSMDDELGGRSYRMYLCGPLEGGGTAEYVLPDERAGDVEKRLGAEEVELAAFVPLVTCVHFFQIEADLVKLAAESMKRVKEGAESLEFFAIARGLAIVAAVCGSSRLADEVGLLVGRWNRGAGRTLSLEQTLEVLLLAAASRSELEEWREYIGRVLTELAFGELRGKDGVLLHSCIQQLCHIEPELWVYCGRADAAVRTYEGRG